MTFTILSGIFQKQLSFVSHALSTRSQLPILSYVIIKAENDAITLTATDLEIGIECKIPCSVEKPGEVAVPAKTLMDLLSNLAEGKITFTLTSQSTLEVKTEHMVSKLQVADAQEFPDVFEDIGTLFLEMDAMELETIIKETTFATSTEPTKPVLTGVLVEKEAGEVRFVASDGFRLSLVTKKTDQASEEKEKIIVSVRFLKELLSLKEDKKIQLFVSPQTNQLVALQGDTKVSGRKIEGEFHKYGRIIPQETSTKVVMNRIELLRAVKVCSVVAKESTSVVTLDIGKESVKVSAKNASVGETTMDVEGKLTGEENAIAFNPRFLLEGINALSTDDVVFEMTGPLNPAAFKNNGSDGFLHIIMPVRV